MKKKFLLTCFLTLLILSIYGLGRLFFHLTDGFLVSNIIADFSFHPEWEIKSLSKEENKEVNEALNQSYTYLGKGFQSYAFLSHDGNFVLKFFKYQGYRLPFWLTYAPPLPAIVKYREQKWASKWNKLETLIKSWKFSIENLKSETGLLFVHLNQTNDIQKQVTLYDKSGLKHSFDLNKIQFCLQRRALLLCPTLLELRNKGNFKEACALIDQLLTLLISEYSRGFVDNDRQLMQNTGVVEGKVIHIDVGEFDYNEEIKHPKNYLQELLYKTQSFNFWLKENYPELGIYLQNELNRFVECKLIKNEDYQC